VEESSRRRFARYVHVKNWNVLFYCSNIAKSENAMLWRLLSRLETCIVYCCIPVRFSEILNWKYNVVSRNVNFHNSYKYPTENPLDVILYLLIIFICSIIIVEKNTAGNRHKQNSWFCKEIREDNFRCWWRRVHEDASQGMYMSKIEMYVWLYCCINCLNVDFLSNYSRFKGTGMVFPKYL
jgi:hypothetical protein